MKEHKPTKWKSYSEKEQKVLQLFYALFLSQNEIIKYS
jgi:DNA-directed RNA polymerase specialized sigma subunit